MSSIARNNWILLLIAAGLSLLLLLTQPAQEHKQQQPISDIDTQSISQVELALGRPNQTKLQLQKRQGQWQLTAPITLMADPLAVGEILLLASSTSHRQFELDELDLSKLQLAPPLWRIRLDDAVFEIGGREAISGRRYVRYKQQVHLIDDLNTARLDNNYADLVTRELLPQNHQILGLVLPDEQAGSREYLADNATAMPLFQQWRHSEAQWLVRPTQLDYQDVNSRASVSLRTADGREYSVDFLILQNGPQLQLIRPDLDLMYMLPSSAQQELLSLPDA